jgi:replicative DNA helicase
MAQAVTDISLNKLPPYNQEAEHSVLGACVKSLEAVAKSLEILTAEDFYKSSNQKTFLVIRELFEANESIDVLTIAEKLRKKSEYEAVGGMDYLDFLEGYVPTASAVRHHKLW